MGMPRRIFDALVADVQSTRASLEGKGAARAMMTLAGGVFGARILTALGYLSIAWLYSPEAFGVFSIYVSICLLLQLLGSAGYSTAIVAEKSERKAVLLTGISLLIGAVVVVAVTLVAWVFPTLVGWMTGVEEISPLLVFLPYALALRLVQTILIQWAVRNGRFREQALSHVAFAGGQTSGQIMFALVGFATPMMLAVVDLVAMILSNWSLMRREVSALSAALKEYVTLTGMWEVAVEWRDLLRYNLPSNFIYGVWQQGPLLVAATAMGGGALLGQVALALRGAELLLQLVNASLSNVAMHHMASAGHEARYQQFRRFTRQLFVAGLTVYLGSIVALHVGSPLVLKSGWEQVPLLFALLTPVYVFNVTVVPVWFVYTLTRRLGRGLVMRIAYLVVLVLAWAYAQAAHDLQVALLVFSVGGAVVGAAVLMDMRRVLYQRIEG